MERRDFLEKLGIGAAFVLTTSCLQSCSKTASGPVDFTLNLDDAANAALKVNGGYVISNNTVVAKTTTGEYVAATIQCSHEDRKEVTYRKSTNTFFCSAHSAEFSLVGKGVSGPSGDGLSVYKTALTGTSLRITS